jgi:hypothetical protein
MTPQKLSRSFTALASHGVMTEGRAIVIKDWENLQRLVHEDPLIAHTESRSILPRRGETLSPSRTHSLCSTVRDSDRCCDD